MAEPAHDAVPAPPRATLSPLRRRLLDLLAEPASASDLARRLDLPRQKINYHLRELHRMGLVEPAGERQRRGFVERRMRAVAGDRFSSAHLYVAASRLADDVATLRERAADAGRPILTFTLEVDIDFASPRDLRAFAAEATEALARLAAAHHRPDEPKARRHRVLLGAHPAITKTPEQAGAEAAAHREARS